MNDYNQFPCDTSLLPTGIGGCVSDLTAVVKLFPVKNGVNFATIAEAQEETAWDTLIQNGDMFPFPLLFAVDNADEDSVIETSGVTGLDHKVREGKSKNTYSIITDLCTHRRLRSFDQFSGGYYAVDDNGNVLGTTNDGVTFDPITIGTMNVNKMTAGDGTVGRKTPVYIVDADPTEFNNRGASIKVDWNILGKNGLLPITLSIVGTPTSTEIIVDAVTSCSGSPVSGLEAISDWVLATAQTISAATESATVLGRYTLSGTGLVSGALDLAAPSVLGVAGYQSVGAKTVTIA